SKGRICAALVFCSRTRKPSPPQRMPRMAKGMVKKVRASNEAHKRATLPQAMPATSHSEGRRDLPAVAAGCGMGRRGEDSVARGEDSSTVRHSRRAACSPTAAMPCMGTTVKKFLQREHCMLPPSDLREALILLLQNGQTAIKGMEADFLP